MIKKTLSLIVVMFLLVSCNSSPSNNQVANETDQDATQEIASTESEVEIPITEPTPTGRAGNEGEFLQRPDGNIIRVLNYNINWDSIFPDDDSKNHSFRDFNRVEEFERIILAVQPDVVCLQEINPYRASSDIADMLADILGNPGWQATRGRDNYIASQFGMIYGEHELDFPQYPGELTQAVGLVNLPDEVYGDQDLFIVCSHFKASGTSSDIKLRQRQADAIISQMYDAITPGGGIDLPSNTPFLLMGDFNIYLTDPAYHLTTLLTGDIVDEDRYGPDVKSDWDNTELSDAQPSINGEGEKFFTWKDVSSNFSPGALDRIIYSDSVLIVRNAFTLDTTKLSDAALETYGLKVNDVVINGQYGVYDHLPMVVDFEVVLNP